MYAWPLWRPPAPESCDDYGRKGCSQVRKTGRPEDPGSVLPLAPCRGVRHHPLLRVPADPAAAAAPGRYTAAAGRINRLSAGRITGAKTQLEGRCPEPVQRPLVMFSSMSKHFLIT